MSWQLGSFSVLAVALAGGFAWYERTRPDARVVALVGTLAAFAALGRIAFAALPNVKPTTDIVLISGYALGGAPGFVIGALAGLVSNFFFGQGPWTPWQMAAWGATGAFGAGLAILTRKAGRRRTRGPRPPESPPRPARIRRWPLALICGLAGYAFAAVQDVGDWVTYSDHSFAQLAVYVGKGIGFDLVHAVGCVAFALAFGPALLRSIQRFATRLQVSWRPPSDVVVPAVLALAAAAVAISPAPAQAATPMSYLLGAQNSDGGLGSSPGQPSSQLYSGWAALGFAAQGLAPQDVRRGGASLLGYISAGEGGLSDVGSLERTILVERAAGAQATDVAGRDLLARLQRDVAGDGSVSDQVNLTSFAVLALRAAGSPVAARTLVWLVRQQNQDGGFSFATAGGASDVDDTGAGLEALAGAAGSAVRARERAVAFIRSQQNRDGGFPEQGGGDSNAQSTAWAVQGLLAAGVDAGSLARAGAPSPLRYLRSLIEPDGHVRYSRGSDQTPVWVTAQAAMALAEKPLPLAAVAHPAGLRRKGARVHRPARAHRSRPRARSHHRQHPRVVRITPARRHLPRQRTGSLMMQLAADAGLAGAIALAPVGLG